MKYTSIVNYYQAVIFYHNIKGLPVAGWSDKLLSQTFKGIKNSNPYVDNTKDPIRPEHLDIMYRQVDMDSYYCLTNGERVSSVVEHSSANPKVPGSIPGPVSYRGHGL